MCGDQWRSFSNYSFETNLGTTLVCSEILLTKFRDILGLPPYPVWPESH